MIVKLQTSQRFVSSSNQHPTPASKSALDILKTKAPLISVYLQWNDEICPSLYSPWMSVDWFFIQLWGTQKWKWLIGINMSVAHWNLCQLSWQQMVQCVQCPVLAECWGAKRCWMLNVETRHCLPTCYWQVLCWWRRTGAQCVQHTPDFVNRSKVFVWREAKNGKMEDIQLQILLSRVGNRT